MSTIERKTIIPEEGHYYYNRGGGIYKCLKTLEKPGDAIMRNISSGWTFRAHGCGIYLDGTIDWDYSGGGYFGKEEPGQ